MKRLIAIGFLSPILALLTSALFANLGSAAVPNFWWAAALQFVGFAAYWWIAGRFGGKGSGWAIAIGLGATFGLMGISLLMAPNRVLRVFALALLVDIILCSVLAEAAGRHRLTRRPGHANSQADGVKP